MPRGSRKTGDPLAVENEIIDVDVERIKEVAAAGWEVDHSLPPRLRIKRAV